MGTFTKRSNDVPKKGSITFETFLIWKDLVSQALEKQSFKELNYFYRERLSKNEKNYLRFLLSQELTAILKLSEKRGLNEEIQSKEVQTTLGKLYAIFLRSTK